MSDNFKVNKRCIKGNTTYFKIKISDMINYEIEKSKDDQGVYQSFDYKITNEFEKFTDKLIAGADFTQSITDLRDEIISECRESENKATSKMRPFFKDYIFDKIYTMGINIKNGILPDDCEKELEEARLKAEEEENKVKEELEKEKERNIEVTIDDTPKEKDTDIIDEMWDYFFGSSKSNNSKNEKKPVKDVKEKSDSKEKESNIEKTKNKV